jgi:N-methylhydantoinase A/oxoprolinase/acetone carboxylase beta subunit
LASFKTPSTDDISAGVTTGIRQVLIEGGIAPGEVAAVLIGTTQFTNALVERRHLLPTAVVRLCGSATRALPPFVDWPDDLRRVAEGRVYLVDGGHQFDGREIAALSSERLDGVAAEISEAGLRSVAISSVFSPVDDRHERAAAEALEGLLPGITISVSSEIGRIGLLERENATIVNACLRDLADHVVSGFEASVRDLGIEAPLYLSQNDGTVMSAEQVKRYPVATFASGPTNSMRGAAHLSGDGDCVVVDVGGTTTDIGVLKGGLPREAAMTVEVAGVRTNLRMPDIISLGIGGGSIVDTDGEVLVGPTSVGHRITKEALIFGGSTLTATDIAVAAGAAQIGDPALVGHLDRGLVQAAMDWIRLGVGEAIERMKTGPQPVPVVLVGGGSILLADDIPGASRVSRPGHFPVANAIGAAIAKVGGQVDHVVSLDHSSRERALAQARAEAADRCVAAGASQSTVEIVEVDEIPLAYLPSNAVRLRVKAIGELEEEHDADSR